METVRETQKTGQMLMLEDTFPNVEVETTKGRFHLYDYIGDSLCVFYSHPLAFTPICTSDLAAVAKLWPEYTKRNLKAIALTTSSNEENLKWQKDIMSVAGLDPNDEFPFAIISDTNRQLATSLGMIRQGKEMEGLPLTVRNAFLIGSDKKIKTMIWYPDEVGRNYVEILRLFDAFQISQQFQLKVGTPANWMIGEKVLVLPTAKSGEFDQLFPKGIQTVRVPSGKEYLRLVDYNQQQ